MVPLLKKFITTAQLHSTKPEPRFCAGSNPAHGLSDICGGGGYLTMVPAGNKAQYFSSVNYTTKSHQKLQPNMSKSRLYLLSPFWEKYDHFFWCIWAIYFCHEIGRGHMSKR